MFVPKSRNFERGTRHFLERKCSPIFIFWVHSSFLFGLFCFLICPSSQHHRWTTKSPLTSQNLLFGSCLTTNRQSEKNPGKKWKLCWPFILQHKPFSTFFVILEHLSNIDYGYPLIWMRFFTFIVLFCFKSLLSLWTKTGLSIPVNLKASKRKEGNSQCLY